MIGIGAAELDEKRTVLLRIEPVNQIVEENPIIIPHHRAILNRPTPRQLADLGGNLIFFHGIHIFQWTERIRYISEINLSRTPSDWVMMATCE